ncbi:MAG TPA: helix-turn-helix domain-containing protein [Candidatus Binataceae bacterium]|nr:helix-turn-helix domain-containing protein [Candidatus Binataceae bacterium]
MRWDSVGETRCSIARALSVVGERWTMLVLREAFLGRKRFEDFHRRTGIARNILSARLHALVENGILTRETDTPPDGHVEYHLTPKGFDLYPVLVSLLRWGDTWMACEAGPPVRLKHRRCEHYATPKLVCSHCGEPIEARGVELVFADPPSRPRRRISTRGRTGAVRSASGK